ncbi:DUF4433 domain-containing protein [Pseudomonas promysalinigenes]|uniref:DUF4433 domain-containing protein n=1 Tax=Pseudomonas promysalinigenes TaxID=485898 RepID=A0ABY6AI56_9PSED|nr:DUF4433 domain-containing protein [Pseudomonas promysalinigenes]UXH38817.1 DUF4433 domain-containing protein [Pseudomonas promysalinigenes]
MSIEQFIAQRGIESVVHFTTNRGSLGIFACNALKSRQRLNADEQLKHIFQPNAKSRDKDLAWLDYANLSISRINMHFFNTCSGSWHREQNFFWCIFDFSPVIMLHENVQFTTTNNIYSGNLRSSGIEGLQRAFQQRTHQFLGNYAERTSDFPVNEPTCNQAEILYPGEVSTRYLQRIYVRSEEHGDELAAQMAATAHPAVEVLVRPELFEKIR